MAAAATSAPETLPASAGDAAHGYVEQHYRPRAHDYLTSATHAQGADLDQIGAFVARWQPARVLDLGCGGGHVTYVAAPHAGEVIACDVTQTMLDVVRDAAAARGLANVRTQCAACEHLPFAAASAAMVLCRFSVHHWVDWQAGLREARRVLPRGGRALFVDTVAPASPLLDTYLQAMEVLRDPSHVRNYSGAEWVAGVAQAGFEVVGITPRRLRLDYAGWVARTRMHAGQSAALRAMQQSAPPSVRAHFAIEPDGSWTLDKWALELIAI